MNASPTTTRGLRSRDTGRTTYLQVGTLIEHLQDQHRRLQETYRARGERPDPGGEAVERADLVFAYLARREGEFGDFLDRLARDRDEGVLETWLQYADLEDYDRKVEEMIAAPPEDAADAVDRILDLDRELSRVYERLAASVSVPAVKELFADLREILEQRLRDHAEHLPQVDDL